MTLTEYTAWVEAYALKPGNVKHAARVMGCTRDRAKRLWFEGEPRDGFGPIRDVVDAQLQEVAQAVRAGREEGKKELARVVARAAELVDANVVETAVFDKLVASQAMRDAAARDAAKVRMDEADLVKAARGNALALAGVTAQILDGALELAGKIQAVLKKAEIGAEFSVKEALSLLRQTATITRFNAESGKFAVQMERLIAGEPTGDPEDDSTAKRMTLSEAERWIQQASEAVKRGRAREEAARAEATDADDPTVH